MNYTQSFTSYVNNTITNLEELYLPSSSSYCGNSNRWFTINILAAGIFAILQIVILISNWKYLKYIIVDYDQHVDYLIFQCLSTKYQKIFLKFKKNTYFLMFVTIFVNVGNFLMDVPYFWGGVWNQILRET